MSAGALARAVVVFAALGGAAGAWAQDPSTGAPVEAAGGGPAPIPVAVVEPAGSEAIGDDARRALGALIASRLDETGAFDVITQDDVRQMISFDKMKTALSCDDEASCLAEIGGALGVPWLVSSTVARVGGTAVLSLSLVDIERASVEARETLTAPDVAGLITALPAGVDRLVRPLLSGRQGTLTLSISVDDAIVEVDGRAVGQSPLSPMTLTQGRHQVRVRKAGYFEIERDVDIRPGETTTLELALARAELGDDLRFLSIGGLLTAGGGVVLGGLGYLGALGFGLLMMRVEAYLPYALLLFVPALGPAATAGALWMGRKQPGLDGAYYVVGVALSLIQVAGLTVLGGGLAAWAYTLFDDGGPSPAGASEE